MIIRALLLSLLCLASVHKGWAAPGSFDSPNTLPPVIEDTTKAEDCTVAYLVTDIRTNDTLEVRMQIRHDFNDHPVKNLYPCPPTIPPRLASRALDACIARAADPKDCVFADMSRGFEKQPKADNTAENYARCQSDQATDIGIACWRSGELQVCATSCGDSPATAIKAAVSRCEAKHQQQCPITGSRPVLAPR
jgi:hypothetical protein